MRLINYLLFLLVPLGIFILLKAIRLVRTGFAGKVLLEIPFRQKTGDFEIRHTGVYAIWQKGEFFRKLPVNQFRPVITHVHTHEQIRLTPSIFRPNSNDGRMVKIELFRFSVDPGTYTLEIGPGSSISALEGLVSELFPAKKVNLDHYSLLVRESLPFTLFIAGLLLMILGSFCIIGGIVAGILVR